jgi:hypothetical protein
MSFNLSYHELYSQIGISITKYKQSEEKSIEQLFFIIMSLNHLREWIAPEYKTKEWDKQTKKMINIEPKNQEEEFSKNIYYYDDFSIIRKICNGIKHLTPITTNIMHNENVDTWKNVDNILNVDKGPIVKILIDNRDIEEIINNVYSFYSKEWFRKSNMNF